MATEETGVDASIRYCIVLRCMEAVPPQSLAEQLRQVSLLFQEGDLERAEELAQKTLGGIGKGARGTRLMAYAVLAQSPAFTPENKEGLLGEASAILREATEKPKEHLAAAWLLTAFGGELVPEERDRVLKIAEAFRMQRKSTKTKTMAMTIIAAYETDTDAVMNVLWGILAEGDERAQEIAFRRAARCFITEDQQRGNRFLQQAIEQASSVRLRDQLKCVREDLRKKQAQAAQEAIESTYREICEGEKLGNEVAPSLLGENLEQYRLLCGVSSDLWQKAQAAFQTGLIAWKCGDTKTARGLHAVALARTELLVSEGNINPADPKVRHLYDWSAYWRKVQE